MFKCWLGHTYKAIKVQNIDDISYGAKEGYPSTLATMRCTVCGKIKTRYFYKAGYLTVQEINNDIQEK